MKFSQLWTWHQSISRLHYLVWGLLLLGLKNTVDRLIAFFFLMPDGPSLIPYYYYYHIPSDFSEAISYYFTLLIASIPFIFAGVGLTFQRLRSADLPRGLVALFFVPGVNLMLFLMLCFWPERDPLSAGEPSAGPVWIPKTKLGSALMSMGLSVGLALFVIVVSVMGFGEYGISLFIGLPFVTGLLTTLFFAGRQERTYKECLAISSLGLVFLGVAIVLVAIEGLICVLMALPLALVLNMMGAWAGWLIQSRRRPLPGQSVMLMLFLPGLMGIEKAARTEPPRVAVVSTVEIQAPPEVVWNHVVSFSELPPPSSWILKTGVAYPIKAEIKGHGVGAVRHCIFSTGPFVEPIEVWDAPRLLKFSVQAQPHPMKELTPYEIAPPHLDHFLRSRAGQFLLVPLASGGTRLEGTTWYTHEIWPAQYWQLWSDYVIHQIHHSVLDHIKNLSETEVLEPLR